MICSKSVTLDNWNREQVASMEHIGNSRSNSIFNPDETKNPPPTNSSQVERDSELEIYIRKKYIHKAFIRKSATIPPPSKGILKATNTGSSTGSNGSGSLGADLNANTSLNSRTSMSPTAFDGIYKQRSASLQAGGNNEVNNQPLINLEGLSTPQDPLQLAPQTLSPQQDTSRSFSLPASLQAQQTGQSQSITGSLYGSPQPFQQSTSNGQPTPFSLNSPLQTNSTLQSMPQSNSPYQNTMSGSNSLYSQSPTSNPMLSLSQSPPSNSPYTTPFQMHQQNGSSGLNTTMPLGSQNTGLSSNGSIHSLHSQPTGSSGLLHPQSTGLRNQSSMQNLQTQNTLRNQPSLQSLGSPGFNTQATLQFQNTGFNSQNGLQNQNTGLPSLQAQPTGKRDWPSPPSFPPISPVSSNTAQQKNTLSVSPMTLSTSPGIASNSPLQKPMNSTFTNSPFQQTPQSTSPGAINSPFQQQQQSISSPFGQSGYNQASQLTPTQNTYSASPFNQPFGQQQFTSPTQNSPFASNNSSSPFGTQQSFAREVTSPPFSSNQTLNNTNQPFTNTNTRTTTTTTFIQQPTNIYQPTTTIQQPQQQFNPNPFQNMMRPSNPNPNPFQYSFN